MSERTKDAVESLQRRYAPANACFGCGQANREGLRIESYVVGDEVVAHWRPADHHQAFPGVLNGGIIGSLLDCHCNWTAAWALMAAAGADRPPCTVTMEYTIKLLRPTPMDAELELRARPTAVEGRRATISGTLAAGGEVCATCTGRFAAVGPGHPAYEAR